MTDDEKKSMQDDRALLLAALREAGAEVKSPGRIVCPFHEDESPSGSTFKKDSVWRFKCHGCGVCEDVIGVRARAAGKSAGDILSENGSSRSSSVGTAKAKKADPSPRVFKDLAELQKSMANVTAVHLYRHPMTSAVELAVFRCEPPGGKKTFIQVSPSPGGGFWMRAPAGPLPIYNRKRVVKAAAAVFVVEGEKCVEALTRLGYVATTSPGGADNGAKADWSPLAGKSDVILWPDQDDVDPKTGVRKGHRHMRIVADLLERLDPAPVVRWFDPTPFQLPAGGDAVDFIAQYGGDDDTDRKRAIQCVIDSAEQIGGASELERMIEDTIAGRRAVISLPWGSLDRLSQALMPGSTTCVCGEPGSSKSLWVIEAALYWHRENVKIAVYMLEDAKEYHLARALAQLSNNSNLTDLRWMRDNPAESRAAHKEHQHFLNGFARRIYAAESELKPVTLRDLADWVEARAKDGCEVIVIDPVTAAETGDKRFIEDMAFVFRVKAILRQHPKSRVILMTHPKNGAKGWGDMAGGTAYPRFSQTVFWLSQHQPPKQVLCEVVTPVSGAVKREATVSRTIKLGKTRNGRGSGLNIGYLFDTRSLRFVEQGVIVKAATVTEDKEDQLVA